MGSRAGMCCLRLRPGPVASAGRRLLPIPLTRPLPPPQTRSPSAAVQLAHQTCGAVRVVALVEQRDLRWVEWPQGQQGRLGPGFARLIDGRFVSRRAAQGGSMRQPHGCFGRRSPLGETARRDGPERDGAGACVRSCGNGRDKLGVRGWQKWRWEQFGVGRVPDARAVLGALVCRAASLTRNVVICGSSGGPGYDNW